MSKPYFYKIKNTLTGKYYVGSQYGKHANKDNLFNTYFTSSQYITDIILNDGIEVLKIVYTKERNDAREYETYYLNRCYSWFGKDKFLSIFYNRSLSPGILLDNDIIEKQTATKKQRWNSGEVTKPIPPNWKGKKRSENMCKKLSDSKMGHEVTFDTRQKLRDANLGKKQTNATKQNRADSLAKNPNAYGKKHWLFVSFTGHYYYTVGKRNIRLYELKLSEGPTFVRYLNTTIPVPAGKNAGWMFFEGESIIKEILKTIDGKNITYYE